MSDPNASAAGGLEPFDPAIDHFARLGLSPSVKLDRDQLEANYLSRSKLVHPDGFVTQAPGLQRLAMEHSAALNQAYAVLRDATARAEYLVKLGGIDLDSSHPSGSNKGAPQPTQAFLMDMIERREALDEAKVQGMDALEDQRDLVEDERNAKVNEARGALDAGDIDAAARALIAARYLARLIEELEHAVEALA